MSGSISALPSRNSKAPFTQSTISKLCDAFQYCCVICMTSGNLIWVIRDNYKKLLIINDN